MAHTLEFFWDFSSPFAYLASTQAEALATRTGATLVHRPMLLGAVFKAIGQVDVPLLAWPQTKQRYFYEDLSRWAAYWQVPFKWPTRFPMNSVKALRAYLALPEARRAAFASGVFRAYWAEDRDISDEGVLGELIGHDAKEIFAKCATPELKNELFAATKHAIDSGVFGAPIWIVDGKELFWGQDRLVLVERALTL